MSKQLILTLSLCFLALGAGYQIAHWSDQKSVDFSSTSPQEKRSYQLKNINVVGKHLSVIRSEIEAVQLPDKDNEVAILKATVYLNQSIDGDLSYKLLWDNDMLVESISGTEGQLDGSLVGQEQIIEFKLKNFSRASKKVVTFLVQARQEGRQFGSTALISSRPEDSMEFNAPAKMESAIEH